MEYYKHKYSHIEKWSGFAEAQLRSLKFYEHYHYYEYKFAINYQFDYKINDETERDFFMIGYYYEIFRNEKSN